MFRCFFSSLHADGSPSVTERRRRLFMIVWNQQGALRGGGYNVVKLSCGLLLLFDVQTIWNMHWVNDAFLRKWRIVLVRPNF